MKDGMVVLNHTWDEFHAEFRKDDDELSHEICIDRKGDELFYIKVYAPSGLMAYDGCWDRPGATMDQAITEALTGSLLVDADYIGPEIWKSHIQACPNCGDNRTGKGSLIFRGKVFCNENCYEDWHALLIAKQQEDAI